MGRHRTLPDAKPRPCAHCGTVFTPERKRWRQKYCSNPCCGRAICTPERNRRIGRGNAEKIGNAKRGKGTKYPYIKEGGQHQHRTVMERLLGRKLKRGEVVHHEDRNGRNNAPGNLSLLVSQAEHARIHAKEMWQARNAKAKAKGA